LIIKVYIKKIVGEDIIFPHKNKSKQKKQTDNIRLKIFYKKI